MYDKLFPNRELESPTAFFSYQFGDYGYDYGDEAKFLKRRGPRTTIKQYQVEKFFGGS